MERTPSWVRPIHATFTQTMRHSRCAGPFEGFGTGPALLHQNTPTLPRWKPSLPPEATPQRSPQPTISVLLQPHRQLSLCHKICVSATGCQSDRTGLRPYQHRIHEWKPELGKVESMLV